MLTVAPDDAAWRIVVDANVFFVLPVREILFYGASRPDPLVTILWPDAILAEVARNWSRVTGRQNAEARWQSFETRFRNVFASGRITTSAALAATSRIAVEDRHVASTALAGEAAGIVTFNTRDFPRAEMATLGLRCWHPDQLFCDLLTRRPAELLATIRVQEQTLRIPRSTADSLAILNTTCPRFVAQARILLAADR